MRRILIAAVMAGMAGGACAAEFDILQNFKASDIKNINAPVAMPDQAVTGSMPVFNKQQYRDAVKQELFAKLGAFIRKWAVPHVEKPSFPFQNQKQYEIWQPVARAQTAQNQSQIGAMVANTDYVKMILAGVEKRLSGQDQPLHATDDPAFRIFYQAFTAATINAANFSYDDGPLVTVGWGSGDQVTVSGNIPYGPDAATSNLSAAITDEVFNNAAMYIAAAPQGPVG